MLRCILQIDINIHNNNNNNNNNSPSYLISLIVKLRVCLLGAGAWAAVEVGGSRLGAR